MHIMKKTVVLNLAFLGFFTLFQCQLRSSDTSPFPKDSKSFLKTFESITPSEKNYFLKKFFLLDYALKANFKLEEPAKKSIKAFLDGILSTDKYKKEIKLKAVDYYDRFNFIPKSSDILFKDFLIFSQNPTEVVKKFIHQTASKKNGWYNDEYYRKLETYIKSNPKISLRNRFLILSLMFSLPVDTKITVKNRKFDDEAELGRYLFVSTYYDTLSKSPEMLSHAHLYSDWASWDAFLNDIEIAELNTLKKDMILLLIHKRLELIEKSKSETLVASYLQSLLKPTSGEIHYLKKSDIPIFQKMAQRSSNIKELCDKIIAALKIKKKKGDTGGK
jgi:hypothetical protein